MNIKKKHCEIIKEKEISLELNLIVPRKELVEVLRRLRETRKTVYLVSDIYFSQYDIKRFLGKCGIEENFYNYLYVSSAIKKRKDDSSMWKYIKSKNDKYNYVHVGDNLVSDYINPKRYKLDSILIYKPLDLYNDSMIRYYKHINAYAESGDKIVKGLIFNKVFYNSPFIGKKKIEDYGYVFFGPLFLYFCKWLYELTSQYHMDKLWFFSREGYYLKPLYDFFCK